MAMFFDTERTRCSIFFATVERHLWLRVARSHVITSNLWQPLTNLTRTSKSQSYEGARASWGCVRAKYGPYRCD